MITLIFSILMIVVFGKLLIWAIKAAWSIAKVLCTLVLLPLILIVMVATGLIYIAIVIVVICGVVTLIASALT